MAMESNEEVASGPIRNPQSAQVALVGAGPGHPGLLTLRAVELLAAADLVLHDRLVPPQLLEHAAPAARRVCVDELASSHVERVPVVHQAMIEAASAGLRVVRLKGGDPFVFGRGGEEAAALREAGISFEIVPGVTAALGAGAFAGIPLTHRDHASAVAFVTGHECHDPAKSSLDWAALARFPGTLVIYMGMTRLAEIARTLIENGKADDTPAATIHRASTGNQHTVGAPLGRLPEAVERAGLTAPAVTIIGPVVALRRQLAWFESRPLFGRRILVTRPRHQAGDLVRSLEALGATAHVLPAVEVRDPPDWGPVDRAIADLPFFHWLVFTSANGVHYLIRRPRQIGRDLRVFGPVKLAAIGPATAEALRSYQLQPDLVPEKYRSEELAAALLDKVRGQRVLLARADRGRDVLRQQLGPVAHVEQVAVYSQVDAELDPGVLDWLRKGEIDLITLTSSNIARSLLGRLDETTRQLIRTGAIRLVTISPVTTAAVRELGLPVAGEAAAYTAAGVVATLCELAHTKSLSEQHRRG
jgi:uroporphyrinogen III methyltransferase/synthase